MSTCGRETGVKKILSAMLTVSLSLFLSLLLFIFSLTIIVIPHSLTHSLTYSLTRSLTRSPVVTLSKLTNTNQSQSIYIILLLLLLLLCYCVYVYVFPRSIQMGLLNFCAAHYSLLRTPCSLPTYLMGNRRSSNTTACLEEQSFLPPQYLNISTITIQPLTRVGTVCLQLHRT